MSHRRTAVRHYALSLLKDKIDVGGRVYANRPSPVFLHELPCLLVFFTAEPVDIIVGDTYSPKEYQRNLRLNVDILTEDPDDLEEPLNASQQGEDLLDALAWQVENAFADDWTFAKLLPGYQTTDTDGGLLMGLRLVSTDPYNLDTNGERRIMAQRLQFETPYETPAYLDKKYSSFSEYQAQFFEVKDGIKTDTILLEAEGEING